MHIPPKMKQARSGGNRKINLRQELAKTFALFRDNINTRIFLFGGYNHFDYVANEYRIMSGLDLFGEISGYVDNDPKKCGTTYNGFPIISPLELQKNDFIILTGSPVHKEMYRQLCGLGFIHRFNFILAWDFEMVIKRFAFSEIRKLKGIHEGERCFIIGNGPSLTIDDLEKLHNKNEYTFASNNFYKLYDKTAFRPDYYVIIDILNLDNCNPISDDDRTTYFISMDCKNHAVSLDNVYFFEKSMWPNYDYYPYKPLFSDDIALSYDCGSVSYIMLQLAFNMGFKEIYLLGMDNNFPLLITHDGTLVQDKSAVHHFYDNTNPTQVCYTKDLFEAGYIYAREFCRNKGVTICNATRGGKLDVFERVDFDSLFPSEDNV